MSYRDKFNDYIQYLSESDEYSKLRGTYLENNNMYIFHIERIKQIYVSNSHDRYVMIGLNSSVRDSFTHYVELYWDLETRTFITVRIKKRNNKYVRVVNILNTYNT